MQGEGGGPAAPAGPLGRNAAGGSPLDITNDLSAAEADSETGRDAQTPLEMPALGWRQIVHRTWRRSHDDNIGLVAAGAAFYAFIAMVPMTIAAALLYSLMGDPLDIVRNAKVLSLLVPHDAAQAIGEQLARVVRNSVKVRGLGILGALAVAGWGSRNAAAALIAALNVAYDEEERRPFRHVSAIALGIAMIGLALALTILVLLGLLGSVEAILPRSSPAANVALRCVAYAAILAVVVAGTSALYRYAPCRAKPKWSWAAPGSLFAAVAWGLLTFGFGIYVRRFGSFTTNYGPSAAGVVTLVWLYFSTIVFLAGGELNAELERQTAADTTEGEDRPLGARGAQAADEVAAGGVAADDRAASEG